MKYIRTKNGHIYEVLKYYMQVDLPSTKLRVENVNKGWHVVIYKTQIIKQANTIEELCDEFVLISEDYYELREDFERAKRGVEIGICKGGIIYGAIWTDKGLIYVAKMNEKGELELL